MLFDGEYWADLLDWVGDELLEHRLISPEDVDLLMVTDDPAEAVSMIVEHYDGRVKEGST